jgi:hypothetical protein
MARFRERQKSNNFGIPGQKVSHNQAVRNNTGQAASKAFIANDSNRVKIAAFGQLRRTESGQWGTAFGLLNARRGWQPAIIEQPFVIILLTADCRVQAA